MGGVFPRKRQYARCFIQTLCQDGSNRKPMKDYSELKDKLRIIEVETDFFSRAPELPSFSRFYVVIISICWLSLVPAAFENRDYLVLSVLLTAVTVNLLGYFQSKKLFELYSNACEIINYYKRSETTIQGD